MIPPERAVNCGKVHVIRARSPSSEEFSSRNLLLFAVYIVRLRERTDVRCDGRTLRATGENIENWVGRQAGNGGAACMFY